jgi:ribose transport system substrate-binding protein
MHAKAQTFVQQKICVAYLNGNDSSTAASVVKVFNDAGIPVFTVNVVVTPADLVNQNAKIVQYLGADNVQGGVISAQQVLKDMGAQANIVFGIVGAPAHEATRERDDGFKQTLASDPNAKFVTLVDGSASPAAALSGASDMLQGNPSMNVIWADSGPNAVGALKAIQSLGLSDKVSLYAFCAADTPVAGPYKACVAQEPADYAKITIDNIVQYFKAQPVQPSILEPCKLFLSGTTPGKGDLG